MAKTFETFEQFHAAYLPKDANCHGCTNNPSKCGCAVRGYYNEKVAKPATKTPSK